MQKLREFITPIIAHFNSTLVGISLDIPEFEPTSNYLEFRSVFLEELNRQISNYMENVFHEYNKLANVFQEDVAVLNKVARNPAILAKMVTSGRIYYFPINEVVPLPGEYRVSNIEIHLINSDYNVNFYINLDELVKILTSYGIYNYYNPNSYPGILAKFYYNAANPIQGICNCERHCSTREKKSICTKITISIFRPGSIIITGSKSIQQLLETYTTINSILFKHYSDIKGIMTEEDVKQNSFLNNELRKLGRKHKIFYFPKSKLITN
jgi:TATA-box binding protein (TBP) (component of TFIID and TFIIIB)